MNFPRNLLLGEFRLTRSTDLETCFDFIIFGLSSVSSRPANYGISRQILLPRNDSPKSGHLPLLSASSFVMPVYHVREYPGWPQDISHADDQEVLFKLKPGVSQELIDGFCEAGRQMVGKIPGEPHQTVCYEPSVLIQSALAGLRDFQVGPALALTAHRAKGYEMAVVAILEDTQAMAAYEPHPAHREYALFAQYPIFNGLTQKGSTN